jgi:hypothetical protein
MLVRIRNVALARDQVGYGRTRQGNRVIWQVAENKQMELLGRRADGRNCLTISVGKICRMTCLLMPELRLPNTRLEAAE